MGLTTLNTYAGIVLVIILLMTTITITRDGFRLNWHSLLIAGSWELHQFGFIVALFQVNSILVFNFFKRLPHIESYFSKAEFTQSIAQVLIAEYDGDNDARYQTPITCGPRDLPHVAHFYRIIHYPLCRHDNF